MKLPNLATLDILIKRCVLTGIAIFLHFFNGEEFVKIQKNPWNITCNKYDDDAKQHNGTSPILCVMFRTPMAKIDT